MSFVNVVEKPNYPPPIRPTEPDDPGPLPPKPTPPVGRIVALVGTHDMSEDDLKMGLGLSRLFGRISEEDLNEIHPDQVAAARRIIAGQYTSSDLDMFHMWIAENNSLNIYARVPVSQAAMDKYESDVAAWEDHKARLEQLLAVNLPNWRKDFDEYNRLLAPWIAYDTFVNTWVISKADDLRQQITDLQKQLEIMCELNIK